MGRADFLLNTKLGNMNRGGSCGGGQSSLGYLFGSEEAPKPSGNKTLATPDEVQTVVQSPKPNSPPEPVDITKQIPAGINSTALNSTAANNYFRADGQNTGNFLTVCRHNKLLFVLLLA